MFDTGRQGYGQALPERDRGVALLDSLDAGRDGHTHGLEYGSAHSFQVAAHRGDVTAHLHKLQEATRTTATT